MTATAQRPIQHGTRSGYRKGCRKDCCRAAAMQAQRDYRENKQPPKQHGTVTGYFTYRCRCGPCRAAGSEYFAAYRAEHPRRVTRLPNLPLEPLEALLHSRGMVWNDVAGGTAVKEWRKNGIPALSADTVACRLGAHPFEVYGDLWWQL